MKAIRTITQLFLVIALCFSVSTAAKAEESEPAQAVPMETIAKIYYQKGVMQALYFVAQKCEGPKIKRVELPTPDGKVVIHCRIPGI